MLVIDILEAETWDEVSRTLGFCSDPQCTYTKAYALYLYLDSLYTQTFVQTQHGGNEEKAMIAQMGPSYLQEEMEDMMLEFPVLVYAHVLQNQTMDFDGDGCAQFYQGLGFAQTTIDNLCLDANPFKQVKDIKVLYNLMSIYFHGNLTIGENNYYYDQFLQTSKLTAAEV